MLIEPTSMGKKEITERRGMGSTVIFSLCVPPDWRVEAKMPSCSVRCVPLVSKVSCCVTVAVGAGCRPRCHGLLDSVWMQALCRCM